MFLLVLRQKKLRDIIIKKYKFQCDFIVEIKDILNDQIDIFDLYREITKIKLYWCYINRNIFKSL